jgi:hypothetical protein
MQHEILILFMQLQMQDFVVPFVVLVVLIILADLILIFRSKHVRSSGPPHKNGDLDESPLPLSKSQQLQLQTERKLPLSDSQQYVSQCDLPQYNRPIYPDPVSPNQR